MITDNLDGELSPIATICQQLIADGENSEEFSNHKSIGNRSKIDSGAYAVTLYAPVSQAEISHYEDLHGISVPQSYQELLVRLNGARIFGFSLYGLPPSMTQDPPLLDRSRAQPLDLATANLYWRHEFSQSQDEFHIGGSHLSLEENVGYFVSEDGSISSYRKGSEHVRTWEGLRAFLDEEILRSKDFYPEFETMMASLRHL